MRHTGTLGRVKSTPTGMSPCPGLLSRRRDPRWPTAAATRSRSVPCVTAGPQVRHGPLPMSCETFVRETCNPASRRTGASFRRTALAASTVVLCAIGVTLGLGPRPPTRRPPLRIQRSRQRHDGDHRGSERQHRHLHLHRAPRHRRRIHLHPAQRCHPARQHHCPGGPRPRPSSVWHRPRSEHATAPPTARSPAPRPAFRSPAGCPTSPLRTATAKRLLQGPHTDSS